MTDQTKIAAVLRRELDRMLAEGRERVIQTPYGQPVVARSYDGDPRGAMEADIEGVDWAIKQFSEDLARRDLRATEPHIRALMRTEGLPETEFQRFGLAWVRICLDALKAKRSWLTEGPADVDAMLHCPTVNPSPTAKALERPNASPPSTGDRNVQLISELLPAYVVTLPPGMPSLRS